MSPSNDIDESLLTALEQLVNTHRAWLQGVATAEGLTPRQIQILSILAVAPPEQRKISSLARVVQVRQPTVTDAVNALQAKGLVERYADYTDARASLVELTANGKKVAKRMSAFPPSVKSKLKKASPSAKSGALSVINDVTSSLAGSVG